MAGTVAHEINSPLFAALGTAQNSWRLIRPTTRRRKISELSFEIYRLSVN